MNNIPTDPLGNSSRPPNDRSEEFESKLNEPSASPDDSIRDIDMPSFADWWAQEKPDTNFDSRYRQGAYEYAKRAWLRWTR